MQENIRLNGLHNVIPIRSALGDYIGEALLWVNAPDKDGFNTIGEPSHPDSQVTGQETVPITTLDTFIEANGISRVDMIKMDAEGAELLVFRGAKNLLQRKDAPLILYESGLCSKGFGYHPVEIMWHLESYGYSLFILDGNSEKICLHKVTRNYDAIVIAIKPGHYFYERLERYLK